jgi:hypothetical protein
MPDWYSHYIYLIVGIIALSVGVVSACIGKTWAPHAGRTIYRAKEPSTFWWVVAMHYTFALAFVGLYLHQTGAI